MGRPKISFNFESESLWIFCALTVANCVFYLKLNVLLAICIHCLTAPYVAFLQFRKRQSRFKNVLDSGHGAGLTFFPTSSSPVPFNSSLDQVT